MIIDNMSINKYLIVDIYLLEIIWDQCSGEFELFKPRKYNTIPCIKVVISLMSQRREPGDQCRSSNKLEHNPLSSNPPKLRTTIRHVI